MSINNKLSQFNSYSKRQQFWLVFISFTMAIALQVVLIKMDEAGLMKKATSTMPVSPADTASLSS